MTEDYGLVDDTQEGFRRGRSTTSEIVCTPDISRDICGYHRYSRYLQISQGSVLREYLMCFSDIQRYLKRYPQISVEISQDIPD